MAFGSRGYSQTPEAKRQRARRDRLADEADRASSSSAPVALPTAPPANQNVPMHETQPVSGPGPDAYAAPPLLPPASEGGEPKPFLSGDAQPVDAEGKPIAAPSTITPEEAKAFAMLVVQYFQFGSQALLTKNPEFAQSLVGMSGSEQAFQQHFRIALSVIAGASERVAMKYNLRIPYMDEAIVLTAIGVASYGLAGKPMKERDRVKNAKNANARERPSKDRDDDKPDEKSEDDKPSQRDQGPFAEDVE
jgi:hypothetical protein